MALKNILLIIAFFVDTAWMQKSVDFGALEDNETPTININESPSHLEGEDFDEYVYYKDGVADSLKLYSGAPWLLKFYAPWCAHC